MSSGVNLHPYDGVTRCFKHTDPNRAAGLDILAHMLCIERSSLSERALYDLSFYSGGMGIIDRLAATLSADAPLIVEIVKAFDAQTPEKLSVDDKSAEDFLWLVHSEEYPEDTARMLAVRFINETRFPFQSECKPEQDIWFASTSTVNSWYVLWRTEDLLHYRGSDVG